MAGHRSPLRKLALILISLVGILAIALVSSSCSPGSYSGKVETITISEGHNETRTLIYVAEERGLFAANGISIVYKDYTSGAAGANALLKGEVDLAAGAEFVVVGNVLKEANIRSIASIDKFQNTYIIGRTDKGVRDVADLKGKRIGVTRQTSPEFYLGRFLELHGMSIREVTLIDGTPAQSAEALISGSVDAVVIFQPETYMSTKTLGNSVVMWPAQSGQLTYFNIFGTAPWVATHQEVISRFLKALSQAENYLVSHPDEAKSIVQKRLQYDDAYINAIWTEHQFSISLDQSLILTMEDEARWMISNNLTSAKMVPNFLDYIDTNGLKTVNPGAVRIAGK